MTGFISSPRSSSLPIMWLALDHRLVREVTEEWQPLDKNIKIKNHTTMVKYLIHGLYDRRISMKIALFLLIIGGQGQRVWHCGGHTELQC